MAVVAGRIEALRATGCDIVFVNLRRRLIGRCGIGITAHAVIDMAGHVDHMARARHQLQQRIRRRLGAFGGVRSLHGVDVEVQCARMVRIAGDHFFKRGDDVRSLTLGCCAVGLPVVPGLGVHHRLGPEGLGVEVVGIAGRQFAHGLREGLVQQAAVGLGVGGIAPGQGGDIGLLAGRDLRRQRLGVVQRRPGRSDGVVGHRQVDVGAQREAEPPPAHGAGGIQPGGLTERADRLGVVEAEHQVDALVEERLRLRRGGDRHVMVAQALEHRRAGLVGLASIDRRHRRQSHPHLRHVVRLRQRGASPQNRDRKEPPAHRPTPPAFDPARPGTPGSRR